MNINQKRTNFHEFMNFFEVRDDIHERIKIYEMLQIWSGIENIVMLWTSGKKYKLNNITNSNLQRKKNECLRNKNTKAKLLNSIELYERDSNIQQFFLFLDYFFTNSHVFNNNGTNRTCQINLIPEKLILLKRSFIILSIKKGFYTPNQLFEFINHLKNDSINNQQTLFLNIKNFIDTLINIHSFLSFNNKSCTKFMSNLFYQYFINTNFSITSNINYVNTCVEYKSNSSRNENQPNYIPFQVAKVFKKGEKLLNSVKKEELTLLYENIIYHRYQIFSNSNNKYLFVLFNIGEIWENEKSLIYKRVITPENNNEGLSNKQKIEKNKLKRFFESLYLKIKDSEQENIILCGHSEGSVYSQAFAMYLFVYHPELIPKIYIIGSGGFYWYLSSENNSKFDEFSNIIRGRNIQFGSYYSWRDELFYYTKYLTPNYLNHSFIMFDPYTLQSYKTRDNLKPNTPVLYINEIMIKKGISQLKISISISKLFQNLSLNTLNDIYIKKNINIHNTNLIFVFVFINTLMIKHDPRIEIRNIHMWKPTYYNAFINLYNHLSIS